jgi:hypothetical protein
MSGQDRVAGDERFADEAAVAFLCSDAAATITGTTISPDLGTTAQ